MQAIIRYSLLVAKRDYLALGVVIACLAALMLAYFIGGTALVEPEKMITSYFASASRAICVIGTILFVTFFVRRAFDLKEIEWFLARPLPRWQCLLGFALGFGLVVLSLCAAVTFIMWVLAVHLYHLTDTIAVFCWGVSLFAECWLMACFALVASSILQSAVSASMLSFAFYIAARIMGFIVSMTQQFYSITALDATLRWISETLALFISVVFPRFDLFSKSDWLIYGIDDTHALWLISIQALIYIPLVISMGILDFNRKEF